MKFGNSSRLSTAVTTGVLALVMALGLASVSIGAASAASGTSSKRAVVAESTQGTMTSKVVGRASDGSKVTGSFTPERFFQSDGALYAEGVLEGVVHDKSGSVREFTTTETMPVKKVDGRPLASARTAARAPSCDILNLVLGPLDLNILGLEIHLQRVVLDIIAVPGEGQLLGNLLCAVAGLLDGGPLAGLLDQLIGLLNDILGALNLGV